MTSDPTVSDGKAVMTNRWWQTAQQKTRHAIAHLAGNAARELAAELAATRIELRQALDGERDAEHRLEKALQELDRFDRYQTAAENQIAALEEENTRLRDELRDLTVNLTGGTARCVDDPCTARHCEIHGTVGAPTQLANQLEMPGSYAHRAATTMTSEMPTVRGDE